MLDHSQKNETLYSCHLFIASCCHQKTQKQGLKDSPIASSGNQSCYPIKSTEFVIKIKVKN